MASSTVLDQVYQAANGVWQEIRRRDTWVYCIAQGNLPQQGGRLQVHYFGRKRFADDFLMFYDRDAIDAKIEQQISYTASPWQFFRQRRAMTSCPPHADVLIVDRVFEPEQSHSDGGGQDSLVATLAPHINGVLPVAATLEAQLEAVRSKGHRRRLQASLKRGIKWRRTHSMADFNLFYDLMYAPFVADRFRYGASVVPREDMRRMFVQRGFLLIVEEDGVPVSGALIYTSRRHPDVMCYWKYGLAHSETLSANVFGERNASQEACVLQYAVEQKFRFIDWGLTKAIPTDGIFAHKKRMGCDFQKTPGAPDFRLHTNPHSRARLLSRFPLIVGQRGRLEGRVAFEPGQNARLSMKQLGETIGSMSFASLHRTLVYVPKEFLADPLLEATVAEVAKETGTPVALATL